LTITRRVSPTSIQIEQTQVIAPGSPVRDTALTLTLCLHDGISNFGHVCVLLPQRSMANYKPVRKMDFICPTTLHPPPQIPQNVTNLPSSMKTARIPSGSAHKYSRPGPPCTNARTQPPAYPSGNGERSLMRAFTCCGSRSSPTGRGRGASRRTQPSCWPGSRCPRPSCSRSGRSSGNRQPADGNGRRMLSQLSLRREIHLLRSATRPSPPNQNYFALDLS
jgi:hypothetical protein